MPQRTRTAAVVVARDRPDTTKRTLDALLAQEPPPEALILVANGATPEVLDCLQRVAGVHGDVEVVELPENQGPAGGFNAGLARVVARDDLDFACCFDDDALPLPGCLAALRAAVAELPAVGTAGAVSHDENGLLAWPMQPADARGVVDTVDDVRALGGGGQAVPVVALCWHGLMIPAEVLRRVGNVRADLFLQFEDAEFALRVRKADLVNYLVTGAEVLHPRRPPGRTLNVLGRRITISHERPSKEYLSLRNELYVHRLHGGVRFWALSGPLILVRGFLTALGLGLPRRRALKDVFGRAVIDSLRGRLGPPPPATTALD